MFFKKKTASITDLNINEDEKIATRSRRRIHLAIFLIDLVLLVYLIYSFVMMFVSL